MAIQCFGQKRLRLHCSPSFLGWRKCAVLTTLAFLDALHPAHPPLHKVFRHAALIVFPVFVHRGDCGVTRMHFWTFMGTAFQHGVPYGYPTVNLGHAIAGGTPVGGLHQLQCQTWHTTSLVTELTFPYLLLQGEEGFRKGRLSRSKQRATLFIMLQAVQKGWRVLKCQPSGCLDPIREKMELQSPVRNTLKPWGVL